MRFAALLLVVVSLVLVGCDLGGRGPIDTVGQVDFDRPLWIPPLAEAQWRDGRLVFELVAQTGRSTFLDGRQTETWGFNGAHLGPTLRARRGDEVLVHLRNQLPEATTVHWHGMHLPAHADGGPHQMVERGGSWSPGWVVDQPAATLWYHPHPHGRTERQVYRGLAGLFIVDDDEEGRLPLPRSYGVDDIPVIVQDKSFDGRGRLVESRRVDNGMLGDTILVNGTVGPLLEVTAERTRLRILNGSTARSYAFGFSDDRPFTMIASDGGLLAAPLRLTRIQLTPGERAEIVIDMRPGEVVTLRSYPQDLGLSRGRARSTGADDLLDIMMIRAADRLTPSPALPDRLAVIEDLSGDRVAIRRSFDLRSNRINGQRMDMARIDAVVAVDTTEVWTLRNTHGQPHNFHVHDVQFQVLSIGGRPPPPELSGWKDTVYLPPRTEVRIVMRFAHYSDAAVPYMFHCHLLWHEDQGMMGQFVVVRPGEVHPARLEGGHGH